MRSQSEKLYRNLIRRAESYKCSAFDIATNYKLPITDRRNRSPFGGKRTWKSKTELQKWKLYEKGRKMQNGGNEAHRKPKPRTECGTQTDRRRRKTTCHVFVETMRKIRRWVCQFPSFFHPFPFVCPKSLVRTVAKYQVIGQNGDEKLAAKHLRSLLYFHRKHADGIGKTFRVRYMVWYSFAERHKISEKWEQMLPKKWIYDKTTRHKRSDGWLAMWLPA